MFDADPPRSTTREQWKKRDRMRRSIRRVADESHRMTRAFAAGNPWLAMMHMVPMARALKSMEANDGP